MNSEVDDYFDSLLNWKVEVTQLRTLLLECGLNEELKWKQPCYTYKGKNIVIISVLKDSFGLGFFKGVLLQDIDQLLVSPGANSNSVRMFKFRGTTQLIETIPVIKDYIFEAIEIEKQGLKIVQNKKVTIDFCSELENCLASDRDFRDAFQGLSIGRQRGYHIFFSAAKQSKTRETRIEKYRERILLGYGINDCTCGQSKRMPNCDGSHKLIS